MMDRLEVNNIYKYIDNLKCEDYRYIVENIFGYNNYKKILNEYIGSFIIVFHEHEMIFYIDDYSIYFMEDGCEELIIKEELSKYRRYMLDKFGIEYAKNLINNL